MAQKPFKAQTSVITCDTQGIVQEYAADAADLFGWSQDEVIGKMSVAMFHVPKNVPTLVPRLLREAVEKGKFEEEVVLMRKDGSTLSCWASPWSASCSSISGRTWRTTPGITGAGTIFRFDISIRSRGEDASCS